MNEHCSAFIFCCSELLSQQRCIITHWDYTNAYYVYGQHLPRPRGIIVPKEEFSGSLLGVWDSFFFFLVYRISYLAQNEAGRLAHQLSAVLTFKQSFSLLSLLAECALSVHRQWPDNESHLLCAILSATCLFERSLSIGRAISTWICQCEYADAGLAVVM